MLVALFDVHLAAASGFRDITYIVVPTPRSGVQEIGSECSIVYKMAL